MFKDAAKKIVTHDLYAPFHAIMTGATAQAIEGKLMKIDNEFINFLKTMKTPDGKTTALKQIAASGATIAEHFSTIVNLLIKAASSMP